MEGSQVVLSCRLTTSLLGDSSLINPVMTLPFVLFVFCICILYFVFCICILYLYFYLYFVFVFLSVFCICDSSLINPVMTPPLSLSQPHPPASFGVNTFLYHANCLGSPGEVFKARLTLPGPEQKSDGHPNFCSSDSI